jgi:hypothetical protein
MNEKWKIRVVNILRKDVNLVMPEPKTNIEKHAKLISGFPNFEETAVGRYDTFRHKKYVTVRLGPVGPLGSVWYLFLGRCGAVRKGRVLSESYAIGDDYFDVNFRLQLMNGALWEQYDKEST